MTPAIQTLTNFLALLAIIGLIGAAAGALATWQFWHTPERLPLRNFIAQLALPLALIVALTGTLLSLFYSDIVGFAPCPLCWYQRIFLYPEIIILGIAMITRDKKFFHYSIPLAMLGGSIAIYHHLIQIGLVAPGNCSLGSISCATRYIFAFDFVTMPLMSLSAFALIIVLSVLSKMATEEPKKMPNQINKL